MPGATICPAEQALRQYLLGRTTPADAAALEQHLEQCEACTARLEAVQAADTMVMALQARSGIAQAAVSEDVQVLANWLKRLAPLRLSDQVTEDAVSTEKVPSADSASAPSDSATGSTMAVFDFLAPAQGPDELGRLAHYRVRRVLGSGGMGVVFEAYDPNLERAVALKAMLPSVAASPVARQRFVREAKAAAGVKHDHIVTIYQVGEDRNVGFLAMELLEGEALGQRLKREGALPVRDVLRIGRECAEALAAAHKQGLIHRDIKPGNIWLERKEEGGSGHTGSVGSQPASFRRVKLLDFGLALPMADSAHLTQSGAIVGTPAFMAPEILNGASVDARADLFSLGCVLYHMATGVPPFKGVHAVSTLIAIATTDPQPPHERNPQLPPALCDLIMLLLAKKPDARPTSARAVVEAIAAIEATQQHPTRPAPRRRRPWLPLAVGGAAVVLLCLLSLGAYFIWPESWRPSVAVDERTETVKTMSGTGKGPQQPFADAAHALEHIVDFRDLVGANDKEFRAWLAQLEPEFRPSLATTRRGSGPPLYNAVAVRAKKPILTRLLPAQTVAMQVEDWTRNCQDSFRPIAITATMPADRKLSWTQAQIWVRDNQSQYTFHGSIDDMKTAVASSRKQGFRTIFLEGRTEVATTPYQTIEAPDQGREWDVLYSLSADELLRAIELFRLKGWRPDVLAPYWLDDRLRFMLVAVNNDGGSDWHFAMGMTVDQYRKESADRHKSGWFPLALVSYGHDADVQYGAIWVRGRAAGSPPPPPAPPDARTPDDRAVQAVTWHGADREALYADDARALKDIVDFQEIAGVQAAKLKEWHGALDKKYRLCYVAARRGTGPALYNAVAVDERNPPPARVLLELDSTTADAEWQRLISEEKFRPVVVCPTFGSDKPPAWHHTSTWVQDRQDYSTWHGVLETVVNGINDGRGAGCRPICLSATMGPDEVGYNTLLGADQGRPSDVFYQLNPNELLDTVDFYQRKGWRPDVIAPCWNGERLRFMLVVVDNRDQVDWRFRMDMSLADYQRDSARQRQQGLFPLALASYGNGDTVRYAAIFVRYRAPSAK
jgi:serine/threonine protein kinase